MDLLREYLAQPEQEPVAWMQSNHLSKLKNGRCEMMLARCSSIKAMSDFIPLYLHPKGKCYFEPRGKWIEKGEE
jgi:hypothetical protein